MDERSPDDPLLALLDTYEVAGSNIEYRVMAQVEQEQERIALRAEVTALRAEVSTLRAELAEIKRILAAGRNIPRPRPVADSRGTTLLPYAHIDKALPILS